MKVKDLVKPEITCTKCHYERGCKYSGKSYNVYGKCLAMKLDTIVYKNDEIVKGEIKMEGIVVNGREIMIWDYVDIRDLDHFFNQSIADGLLQERAREKVYILTKCWESSDEHDEKISVASRDLETIRKFIEDNPPDEDHFYEIHLINLI